jgi:hypothetical protein
MALDPFVRNLDAFTQALGVENAGMVFSLSAIPWPTDEKRDEFINEMFGVDLVRRRMYG